MEVFVDLLPPSYTVKAAPSAKESPRKRQQERDKNENTELAAESEQDIIKTDTDIALNEDRRKGDDRRQQRINRGRWLESRDRNDRRATELAIFVKV